MAYTYSTLNYSLSGVDQSTFLTGIYGTSIVGMYVDSSALDHGLLYDTQTLTWVDINDPLGVSTVPYGPSSGSFATGITIVGSYKISGQQNDNGFIFNSAAAAGSQYTTINVPTAVNTIPHSTYNGLVVGNFDNTQQSNPDYLTYPVAGNAFIYDISTTTFTTNDKPGADSTTAYGIWNGIIAGGYTDPSVGGVALTHGYMYDMGTSTWTSYDHPGSALVTHFDGITGGSVANSYVLTGDWVSAASPTTPQAFAVTITNGVAGPWVDLSAPGSTLTSGNSGYGNTVIGVYTTTANSNSNGYVATAACFLRGTRILTERGEIAIEDLVAEQDWAVTASGHGARIVWIGQRMADLRRHPRPWDVMPVRILADAFGPCRPLRDLVVSPDHALLIEGVLIPARALINGATVVQETHDRAGWFHVELEWHDAILAEGLATESYLDTGNRHAFDNGGLPVMLHADFAASTAAALAIWAEQGMAPLHTEGEAVTRARTQLMARANELGFTVTVDDAPHLLVDGRRVDPRAAKFGLEFDVPAGARRVLLCSKASAPADTDAGSDDRRVLGLAVAELELDGQSVPQHGAGWYGREAEWQWTDGQAEVACDGARSLWVRLADIGLRRWQAPEQGLRALG